MEDKLKKAKNQILHKTFIQKGNRFKNHVTDITFNSLNSEILVGYKTINHDKETIAIMELNQFIGSHFI